MYVRISQIVNVVCSLIGFASPSNIKNRPLVYFCIIGAAFVFSFGPHRGKTCPRGFAKNKETDQPAHPRSLISAFVVCFLESIICKLATAKILFF